MYLSESIKATKYILYDNTEKDETFSIGSTNSQVRTTNHKTFMEIFRQSNCFMKYHCIKFQTKKLSVFQRNFPRFKKLINKQYKPKF